MRYGPKQITIDGRALTLRSPGGADGAAMLDYFRTISGETEYMSSYLDEITYTAEDEAKLMEERLASPDVVMIAAFVGDRVEGAVTLAAVGPKSKMRHRTNLGIALRQEVCGMGLGRFLMEEAEHYAREMRFDQIELGVFSDNARALRLYKTMGYAVYGTIPRAFRLRDGSYRDEILMVKTLTTRE